MAAQNSTFEEPDFISFLFSSKLKYDCYFLVGNENYIKPERIGVVKAMLMAHSVVLRLELEDSKLAEKKDVPVPDVYPDTFRFLLRYVYGQDTTAALSFDEADNLLYVAEKYMMGTLKKKLATRLMSLLNTGNICSLLNNPVCFTELELNSAITKILRYETDRVLASPFFPDLSTEGFVKILEQDGLNVPEIELWRAMMKWAKHNANSEDGKSLRGQVSKLTKHIKICTLNSQQISQEVVLTDVLTSDEVVLVYESIGQRKIKSGLSNFCNEVKPRTLLQKVYNILKLEKKQFQIQFTNHRLTSFCTREFVFTVVTKSYEIELLPLECATVAWPKTAPEGATHMVSCTTAITRITNYQNDTSTEDAVIVRFNKRVECETTFKIPLMSEGHDVTLLPNNRYSFRMVFREDQPMCYDPLSRATVYVSSHLSLIIKPQRYGWHPVPMLGLRYNAVNALRLQ